MKRFAKKALSMLLAIVMAFALVPAPAFAEVVEGAMGEEPVVAAVGEPTAEGAMGEEPLVAVAGETTTTESTAKKNGSNEPVPWPGTEHATGGHANPPVKSIHDANETRGLAPQDTLPAAYSSVDAGCVTSIKEQGSHGVCWAFSTIAAVESSMLRNGPALGLDKDNLDLSERHLAYFSFNTPADLLDNTGGDRVLLRNDTFTRSPEEGFWSYLNNWGNGYNAGMTLSAWVGVAVEQTAPYHPLYETYYRWQGNEWCNVEQTYQEFLDSTNLSQDIARNDVAHLKDMYLISPTDADCIKRAITEFGGVVYSFYTDSSNYKYDNDGRQYYYYNNDNDISLNHDVEIVGWDDNVSADLFESSDGIKPGRNGAWLCKNSWGYDYIGGSFFWLSYDDASCKSSDGNSAIAYVMEAVDKEDNLYMHDGGAADNDFCNRVDSGGSVASVFTAKANDAGELLDAVSFLVFDTNVDYSLQIYMDPTNASDPTSGTAMLATPVSGKAVMAGLHKIDLPQAIYLYPGATFAVVAKLSHADGSTVSYGVYASKPDGWYREEAVALAGESFERNNPRSAWKDLVTSTDIDESDTSNCNARVRAYTKKADLTDRMTLENSVVETIADQPYQGIEVRPEPTVTIDGHRLRKDVDYELSYQNNTARGTATVIVSGKGNYTGTKSATFKIVAKTFPDVAAGAWYADVVSRAAGFGLISGYSDGRFGPNDRITRGQVAVVLWNMAGGPRAGAGARDFPDVRSSDYFYNAVRWASSAGVVSGYANGRFGPSDSVTREQLAVMLANYAKSVAHRQVSGSAADYASMSDASKVSSWAVTSVGWCFRNKILSGSKGRVLPQGNATRAEAAKMVVVLRDLVY